MKKLFLSINLFLGAFFTFSQNSAVIVAPKYFKNSAPINLPIPSFSNGNTTVPIGITPQSGQSIVDEAFQYVLDGYDGQPAKAGQNIMVNSNGDLIFFVVDNGVYDRYGRALGLIRNLDLIDNEDQYHRYAFGMVSEIAIVPIPNKCNEYYIITTRPNTNGENAGLYYSHLIVNYDFSGNLLEGSGLVEDPNLELKTAYSFSEFMGSNYQTYFNNQQENAPSFALSEPKFDSPSHIDRYDMFVENNGKVLHFKIKENGIQFIGLVFDFAQAFPGNTSISRFDRCESELITYGGNYRFAFVHYFSNGLGNYITFPVIDITQNGTYINGSVKRPEINFEGASSLFTAKGLEFAPHGERLYVTHNQDGPITNAFDYFELTTLFPVRNQIQVNGVNMSDFQLSQIESLPDGSLILARNTSVAKLSNPDNPNFSSDFQANFINLNNYFTHAPHYPIEDYHCLVHHLQDNIDQQDYDFFDNKYYHFDTYNATGNTDILWEPNIGGSSNNPLLAINNPDDEVYIKDLLFIPRDQVITIKNMKIHFAPGARLIIENGDPNITGSKGGKLTLDGTTLTYDERCAGDMWQGVEVWGLANYPQGSLFNTKQGILELKNNSKIEHAYIGALASKRNDDFEEHPASSSYLSELMGEFMINTNNGGIIISRNSIFFNNQISVFINTYNSTASSQCFFDKNQFIWNNALINQEVPYMNHLFINGINTINSISNKFYNNSNDINYQFKGIGIYAINSKFIVKPTCTSPNCNTYSDQNVFRGLNNGIYAKNSDLRTFSVDQTLFDNNMYGINANGTQKELITRNRFNIHERPFVQTAGITLNGSTKYWVTENTFNNNTNILPVANVRSYGIHVKSSGVEDNEIYKNTFKNLYVGGQSEGINASSGTFLPAQKGLQWLCNSFETKIVDADLRVVKGKIRYHQGKPSTSLMPFNTVIQNAARNNFSENISGGEHDIKIDFVSQQIKYFWLNYANNRPDSYTLNKVQSVQSIYSPSGTSPYNTCPSILIPKTELQTQNTSLGIQLQELKNLLDGGDKEALIYLVETNTNLNQIYSILNQYSPYLSDDVLLAYIDRNPNIGQLKQILLANSQLSKEVLQRVENISMPNGVKKQILDAQNQISKRQELEIEISEIDRIITKNENAIHHYTMLEENGDELVIPDLEYSIKNENKKLLLDLYRQKNNNTKFNEIKENLQLNSENQSFISYEEMKKEFATAELEMIPIYLESMQIFSEQVDDIVIKSLAENVVQIINGIIEVDEFEEPENSNGFFIQSDQIENSVSEEVNKFTHIYPNPSEHELFVDLYNFQDSKLEVEIFDLTGKILKKYEFQNTNGEKLFLDDYLQGIYIIKITINNELKETHKLEIK